MRVVVNGWAWLDSSELTQQQRKALKEDLTITPKKNDNYPTDDEVDPNLYLFDERPGRFAVPRAYFMKHRRSVHQVEMATSHGDATVWSRSPVTFAGSLRPAQIEARDAALHCYEHGDLGGIIRAVPGFGKTVVACSIIAALKMPTLIVVHKEFLLNQWRERIKQFLPNARIGHVQQDILDYRDKHIVLGMVHTLSGKDYSKEFYEYFGLSITDEVHHMAARTFSKVPPKFPTTLNLGLSATPRRKDGTEDVFFHHIGPVIHTAKEVRLTPKVKRVWTSFSLVKTDKFNPNLAPRYLLLRLLCAAPRRNAQIVEMMIQALKAGRKLLVLSERLNHLDKLGKMLLACWRPEDGSEPTIGKYVGGMSEEALDASATKDVILATSQLAQEGLDIPALDTLFITTPMTDVEQACGRCLREYAGKKDPMIVDFRDDHISQFERQGRARDRFYSRTFKQ